jgi:hypothetical protein
MYMLILTNFLFSSPSPINGAHLLTQKFHDFQSNLAPKPSSRNGQLVTTGTGGLVEMGSWQKGRLAGTGDWQKNGRLVEMGGWRERAVV